ncbi:MAG TPA: hypothetical protein VFO76_10540 [Candidatus Kapabacteria bacterium]|nr:hypothetical protein [Candidatus Kapabacteria bacterium]
MSISAGDFVYCIETGSPMYGRKLKVDLVAEHGEIIFAGIDSGSPMRFSVDQISEERPEDADTSGLDELRDLLKGG